jgi:hypothetical protein
MRLGIYIATIANFVIVSEIAASVRIVVVKMALQFVKSNKGADLLHYLGFLHRKEKCIAGKTIWKCASYHIARCPGRAHTENGSVVKFKCHNHVPDAAEVQKKKLVNTMKKQAIVSHESSQRVVCALAENASTAVSGQLPKLNSLKRTIQRVRHISRNEPCNPKSLSELIVNGAYTETSDGRQFLVYDSNDAECRFLIFTTEENMLFLDSCDHWFADGTFKSVPPLFNQMYTIHGLKYGNVFPAVFILMSNRRKGTYKRVFQALKELQPTLLPVSILTDFELSSMGAIQEEFPLSERRGCFFLFLSVRVASSTVMWTTRTIFIRFRFCSEC